MGKCIYCGEPAGFLKSRHKECEERELARKKSIQDGKEKLLKALTNDLVSGVGLQQYEFESMLAPLALDDANKKELAIKAWENAADAILSNGPPSKEAEERLLDFSTTNWLDTRELDRNGAYTRIKKSAVLRDLVSGIIPEYDDLYISTINFSKNEKTVWVFENCTYYEDKIRRTYEGKSQGVSIRIMKGVYYRVGAFKGNPVEHTERVHVDTGQMIVTDKNIYFSGPRYSTKIPYKKIVSYQPYSDGIGLIRSAATAKPQTFVTGDGWFAYNLVMNLTEG